MKNEEINNEEQTERPSKKSNPPIFLSSILKKQ